MAFVNPSTISGFATAAPCVQSALSNAFDTSVTWSACNSNVPSSSYVSCLCSADSAAIVTQLSIDIIDYDGGCTNPQLTQAVSIFNNLCSGNGGGAATTAPVSTMATTASRTMAQPGTTASNPTSFPTSSSASASGGLVSGSSAVTATASSTSSGSSSGGPTNEAHNGQTDALGVGLGAGLGVGIPVVLVLFFLLRWFERGYLSRKSSGPDTLSVWRRRDQGGNGSVAPSSHSFWG